MTNRWMVCTAVVVLAGGLAASASAALTVAYGYNGSSDNFQTFGTTVGGSIPAMLTTPTGNLLASGTISSAGGYHRLSSTFTAGQNPDNGGATGVSNLASGTAQWVAYNSWTDMWLQADWTSPQNITNIATYSYNSDSRSIQEYSVYYSNAVTAPAVVGGDAFANPAAPGAGWTLLGTTFTNANGAATTNSDAVLGSAAIGKQTGVDISTGGLTAQHLLFVFFDSSGDSTVRGTSVGNNGTALQQIDILSVPEPASLALLGLGTLMLLPRRRPAA